MAIRMMPSRWFWWAATLATAKKQLIRLAMTRQMGDGPGLLLPVDFSQREVFLLLELQNRVRGGELTGDTAQGE